MSSCAVGMRELIDYRFGELEESEAARFEEHLFACPRCGTRAAFLMELGEALGALVAEGAVSGGATRNLLESAGEHGLVLREYRLAPGQTVACTAGPEDDFVVLRLELDALPCAEADVDSSVTFPETGEQASSSLGQVAVDREANEIVYLFSGDYVRGLPRSVWVIHARLRGPAGEERRLGPYVMDHTPWAELPGGEPRA